MARTSTRKTTVKKTAPAPAAPVKKAASVAKKTTATTARKAASTTKKAAATAKKTVTKAAPAKKAPAKKAPTKKTPAKKAAPAKKTAPAKTAPAKKSAPAKKAPAKKTPAKDAPAKKAPAKKAPAKKAPAGKTAAKKTAPARAAGTAVATRPTRSSTRAGSAAPARKAVSALVVKEGEVAWTKAEIKEVLSELHSDRDRVVRTLSGQEAELDKLMRDAGDGAGHDQADMGATSFERDQEIIVVNNEREKLAQIDRALARIADGTYGMCESCGNPIGKMRAMAFPRATLCMTCKQREERR
jgi:RNA polymerase-binding protein DksA